MYLFADFKMIQRPLLLLHLFCKSTQGKRGIVVGEGVGGGAASDIGVDVSGLDSAHSLSHVKLLAVFKH